MSNEELLRIEHAIQIGFETLALSVTTAILTSGWVPDNPNPPECPRTSKAIHAARNIVNDAASTAIARRLR